MSIYIAVIRFTSRAGGPTLNPALDRLLSCLPGIDNTDFDWSGHSLLVWFDRAAVSLGDIVRLLEDHGLAVSGVAQSPANVGAHIQSLSA